MRTELVTTLERKATNLINRLSKDHQSVLITQHGVPAAFLVDVETFHQMQRRISLLEGIARGEKAVFEKRVVSHAESRKRMERWLK